MKGAGRAWAENRVALLAFTRTPSAKGRAQELAGKCSKVVMACHMLVHDLTPAVCPLSCCHVVRHAARRAANPAWLLSPLA